MQVPFAVQSYQSDSLPLSAQRCINAYAEQAPEDAKTRVAVFGAPGLVSFATCGVGPIRGMHVMNSTLYVVSGGEFYSVSSAGTATLLGGTISGTSRVMLSDNGTQICIVNGVSGYIYSAAAGFQLIADADFNAANTVAFFDNYFVFDWANTNKVFLSNTLDGTRFSALDFSSAEVSSDFVVAVVNHQENLLVFGQRTIETWYDSGAPSFPFSRVDGGTIERGCAAALTPVKEDNAIYFLGDDLVFYRILGGQLQRVSTHAIESHWATYTSVSDAHTFSYTHNGHKFVVLTFPTANASWVVDISTGLWHERDSLDMNAKSYGRWRGNCGIRVYNKNIIGDEYSGRVGYLDADVFTEFDNTMLSAFTSPPIHKDRKRVFVSRFEMDVESGVGITTGQGSDPQIMLSYSKDGGRTYSAPELWASMGAIGAYQTRMRWTRLGESREWVFKVSISDPVKRVILAANADISAGM